MQPQHSCSTLESHNKMFGCTVQESLYTLLTIISCYTGHIYTPKAFDASQIKLRPRRLQPNLSYSPSSHSRVDMVLPSGPTIHFCFPYISKSNGWQV